jgi:single-strand DNA-binding protein
MSVKDVHVTIRGNACKDADRTGNTIEETVGVRIAVNRRYFDKAAQQYKDVQSTDYYNVYGTGALGRNMQASIHKGDPVVVTGRLNFSEWAKEDGTEGHSMVIRADAIGHDLTFGISTLRRSGRAEETPGIDYDSGLPRPRSMSVVPPRPTDADETRDGDLEDSAVDPEGSDESTAENSSAEAEEKEPAGAPF